MSARPRIATGYSLRVVDAQGATRYQSSMNVTMAVAAVVLLGGVAALVILLGRAAPGSLRHASDLGEQLATAESQNEQLSAAITSLGPVAGVVRAWHDQLKLPSHANDPVPEDLADVVGPEANDPARSLADLAAEMREWRSDLSTISDAETGLRSLLAEIPNRWPVGNGGGWVSFEFGPALHPVSHTWYLHRGIDIGGMKGWPIVAMADGVVIRTDYTPANYGRRVIVEHAYGFESMYAHLDTIAVREGQRVASGDIVGRLGNTGLVTGNAVHIEISIGGVLQDPAYFLSMTNRFERRTERRR